MGNIGWGEMLVIAILALLLFGPSKLPEMGKSLGTAIQEFKKAMNTSAQPQAPDPNAAPPMAAAPAPRRRSPARKGRKRR